MLTPRAHAVRRRLVDDERGMTLVELLVGIMAATVVIGAGYMMFSVALTSQTRTDDRIDALSRGRTAMERITRDIRSQQCLDSSTPAMQWAGNTGMQFYTSVAEDYIALNKPGGQPVERRRLQWQQTGKIKDPTIKPSGEAVVGKIVETVWRSPQTAPPYSFPVAPTKTTILALDVESDPAVPMFRYYGYEGVKVGRPSKTPFPVTVPSSIGGAGVLGVASADLARIVLVDIRYLSRPKRQRNGGRSAEAVTFANRVSVRTADPSDPLRSPLCL